MLVLAMLKNSVLEGYDSLDNSWNYMVYVNARDKEKPYIRTCIKKHFSLFCIFIKTPRMSRLCLLIITHWQDIYNKSCFSHRQYKTQRLLGGLHNHFLALWIYKKQQSDKKRAHMRSPRSCFLLPPLFSQSTFCKALQGTRPFYDDSAYSSLTTQIHTHTNSKLYNSSGKREECFSSCVLYAKCIYFFLLI